LWAQFEGLKTLNKNMNKTIRLICTSTLAVLSLANIAHADCNLYPIALSSQTLANVAPGTLITDIYNGSQPGNFGWLTWAGSPSEPTLMASLTVPGNSGTYVNPMNPADNLVSTGDWVQGKPGVSNSTAVRGALDILERIVITVPVWDVAAKKGNNTVYHVVGFANVQIISYKLPSQNKISAVFLGYVNCYGHGVSE